MAKKFGKFLLFSAAVGSAAAAAYYYFKKKDAESDLLEDEDYDDFSEDLDDDAETSRNYVSLTPEPEEKKEDDNKESFVPLNQVAQSADKAETAENSKSESNVEEFFDEEDGTDEEPLITDN